jgi:hypothetical protein
MAAAPLPGRSVAIRRISAGSPDPLAFRLRAAAWAGQAGEALHPPSLPAGAIACLRRVRCAPAALHPGGIALREALERMLRAAARPAAGAVPAGAEAVVFADAAEMLACLAADWLDGSLPLRWWWRSLLRPGSGTGPPPLAAGETPATAWTAHPESVPAALAELARRGLATCFAVALPEEACANLAVAVATRHGLPPPPPLPVPRPAPPDTAETGEAGIAVAPPAFAVVPEAAAPGLAPGQVRFLAWGLLLHRAPALARRLAAEPGHPAWLGRSFAPEPGHPARLGPAPVPPEPRTAREEPAGNPPAPPALLPAAPGGREPGRAPPPPDTPAEPSPPAAPAAAPLTAAPDMAATPPPPTPRPAAPQGLPPLGPAPVESGYGGLLYLLNLLLRLDLYGDFTQPARPGLALSPWDALSLLGEGLLGPALREDPIWPLLAALAGREAADPPGIDFAPPDAWRLPPDWFAAFPGRRDWRWQAGFGRLLLRDAAGFAVLDLPRQGAHPAALLARELRPYQAAARSRLRRLRHAAARPGTPLERWLGWLLGYIRPRLCRALGEAEPGRAARLLCRHAARITLTAGQVEAEFSLAAHPLAIRLAGLDRDPGWIPAAGRAVAFRYEPWP